MTETPYRLTERDLDLILLEELSSDTGFLAWFSTHLRLGDCTFVSAEHSAIAKSGAKWGETDVLAFLASDDVITVVLIEDKIAAQFTDRQAARYQERAADLVASGAADRSLTVLCAPQSYLAGVPADDPWDRRIAIETVVGWFESVPGFRASWRSRALRGCLARLLASRSAGSETVRKFSSELREYLISLNEGFDHLVTGDNWGFIIRSDRTPAHVQIAWKNNCGHVDLTFSGPNVGKASAATAPEGVNFNVADGINLKSDVFSVDVTVSDVTISLQNQMDIVSEVMDAIRKLLPLVPKVLNGV
ncbi:MAG: hypothetical protein RIC87_05050 [Kiloniellales bacterium]